MSSHWLSDLPIRFPHFPWLNGVSISARRTAETIVFCIFWEYTEIVLVHLHLQECPQRFFRKDIRTTRFTTDDFFFRSWIFRISVQRTIWHMTASTDIYRLGSPRILYIAQPVVLPPGTTGPFHGSRMVTGFALNRVSYQSSNGTQNGYSRSNTKR